MAVQTRRIGLSLGADLCWPACFEAIVKRLDLRLPSGRDTIDFAVERVRVEPYNLQYTPRYDVVVDRITHWFPTTREWVKKIAIMDDVYVLNNPWMIQAAEKHTTYAAMMRLGFPVPPTAMLPPKEYEDTGDVLATVRRYNKLFDLGAAARDVGFPLFMKPYDGGAWRGVTMVKDEAGLHRSYDQSGKQVMHLQRAVDGWDLFVRAIGIGPQVNCIKYDPDAPLHARYVVAENFMDAEGLATMTQYARVINAFFRWDYNSCEALRAGGTFFPIDFANACPDSQVTSLHYHFPWMVRSMVAWVLFCAATRRKPGINPNWAPYFEIASGPGSFREKLAQYDALARAYFDEERFADFRATHLRDLDRVCLEFFPTPEAKEIVRQKVAALFPEHEIAPFTDHFHDLVKQWVADESRRIPGGS